MRGRSQKCDRARAWISADLDGELSVFESVLLRAHSGRCDSCSTFWADAASFTTALRVAPLEVMSEPVSVPHRRRILFQPLRVPVAAAAAVSMIAFGSLFATLHSGGILGQSSLSSAAAFDDQDLRQLQREVGPQALAQLRVRRAQETSGVTSPHTGFQNP